MHHFCGVFVFKKQKTKKAEKHRKHKKKQLKIKKWKEWNCIPGVPVPVRIYGGIIQAMADENDVLVTEAGAQCLNTLHSVWTTKDAHGLLFFHFFF